MVFPVPAEPETRAGPGVAPFHPLALLWVQKDRPFVPRKIQGALQFFDVFHHPETSLRVGVIERACRTGDSLRNARLSTGCQFEERFCGLARKAMRIRGCATREAASKPCRFG